MTAMLVGRCATCGEVTGEVVPAGEGLTKTYCPSCEAIQYNPTRNHIRFPTLQTPETTTRVAAGRWFFDELTTEATAEAPTIHPVRARQPHETNENDQVLCPHCGSNDFSWRGSATRVETSRVEYNTTFYGHVYADNDREHEDYDIEDTLRSDILNSETDDTEYSDGYRCDHCGYIMEE